MPSLLRDWETDLSRFCRRGVGTEFTDTAGRGHTPGWLLSAFVRFTFYRVTLIRPSVRTGAPSPLEGGRLGGRLIAAPTKWVETCPLIRLAFARHLPPKGKAFGRPQGSPLRQIRKQQHFSRRGRSQTGPPGFVPGALAWQTQAQILDRTSGIFCTPRAQWPGGNSDRPLRFCAPEKMHGLSGGRPP